MVSVIEPIAITWPGLATICGWPLITSRYFGYSPSGVPSCSLPIQARYWGSSLRPEKAAQVAPPSALRNRPCGEVPAYQTPGSSAPAGVSRIALDYQLPVANAILTTENMEQAVARQVEKGRDAAQVAIEMANLLEDL